MHEIHDQCARRLKSALMASVVMAAGAISTHAFAQDAAQQGAAASNTIGDIIVTARRREERLQDVPVSVSAQTGEQLAAQGVTTALNLGKIAPSLVVTPSPRGSNTPYFVIRGQRLIDTSIVLDPVTVVYMNELPMMRPQGLNGALFDIQSVQVLRGPQGTLFGRNTTGGAVLVTSSPAVDRIEGKVAITAGDYNLRTFEGVFNFPIGERAALRVSAIRSIRDGYMTNRATGYDSNDENYDAQRVTFHWEPVDGFVTNTIFNRLHSHDHGTASQIYAVLPTASTNPTLAALNAEVALNRTDRYRFGSDVPQREIARTWDLTNISTLDLGGGISLKNVLGYRKVSTQSDFDLDGSPVFTQRFYGVTKARQISDEFQVIGEGKSFDWLAGLFYFREKGDDVANSYQGATPTILRSSGVVNVLNNSYSAFLSGTYRFTDALSVSAGARITHDKRQGDGLQMVGAACGFRRLDGTLIAPPCLWPQQASFTQPSWSASVNYKVAPDVLLYVAHRHGYRSGGIQSRASSEAASVPFDPEKVNDIELGIKSSVDLGGMKLRFNADVYQAWYKGLQRQISFVSPVSGTLVSGLLNAATSRVRGIELESTLVPVEGLELSGSMGYVDGTYKSFINNGADISSQPFSYVPTWTVNASARYTLPLDQSVGKVSLGYNFRYQSGFINSDTPQPLQSIRGYNISDIRLDWNRVMDSNFSLAVYVNNLFDRYYNPYSTNLLSSLGVGTVMVGPPRMFGVQGRYDF